MTQNQYLQEMEPPHESGTSSQHEHSDPDSSGNKKVSIDDPLSEMLGYTESSKHIGEGSARLIKSLGIGIGAGVASLVAAPVDGARRDGARGFAKGCALGVAGAVVLPVAGAMYGTSEFLRGTLNTPRAIKAKADDMEWDKEQSAYANYSLDDEAAAVLCVDIPNRFPKKVSSTASAKAYQVKDMEYYEVLGIDTSASTNEIKRRYYKIARECHPDKNPNNPDAAKHFQQAAISYQVLSDPILREKYDKCGKETSDYAPTVDPKTFFAMVFGSEDFELLVGTLKMATLAMNDGIMSQAEAEFRQRKREVECALNLRSIVMTYDPSCEEVFVNTLRLSELGSTCFGKELLRVIGYGYTVAGLKHFNRKTPVVGNLWLSLKHRGHIFGNKAAMAGSCVKVLWNHRLANILEALWHISILDIESTIRAAAHKILFDKSVDVSTIDLRARALIVMGCAFESASNEEDDQCDSDGDDDGTLPKQKKTWRDHLRDLEASVEAKCSSSSVPSESEQNSTQAAMPTSSSSHEKNKDFWACPKCTLENPISENSCSLCDCPK